MPANEDNHLPPHVRWLLAFQVFNAFNFTLVLGAPVVLTARYIGASESEIGLMNAMMPLMVSLQLLGTLAVGWLGYRRTMVWGWGLRSFSLLIIVPLPFLVGNARSETLVLLMLLGILGFTSIRGVASAAWFPWLSNLLPEGKRGNFLGMEQRVMNASAFIALIACGWFLGDNPAPWQYSMMFVFAWLAGLGSVGMLLRVPETGAGLRRAESPRRKISQFWPAVRRVLSHKPFRRTLLYVCAFSLAMMAQPVFLVLYLREGIQFGEGMILKLQAGATLGVLTTAVFWGRLTDKIGSRPLLRICDIGIFSTIGFWLVCALGGFSPSVPLAFTVFFAGGIFIAAHAVSQTRLLFGCCPEDVLTFAMALFQVIVSLCGATAPILFGLVLEKMLENSSAAPGPRSIPFAVLFGSFIIVGIVSQFLLSHVPDPKRVPTRRVLLGVLYGWPMRILSGLMSDGGPRGERK